jgi:hypothetical protein
MKVAATVGACWVVVVGLLGSAEVSAQIARSVMLPIAPSVMKIEAIGADGRFQLGSGVIVGPGKVVTNCHVTRNAERIDVVRAGMRWRVAKQAADMPRDLCILQIPRLEGEPVKIARASSLKPAQDVLAMGYTGGVGVQLSDGDVVALHAWSGGSIVQTSNWFTSGASGGGLFNGEGALVGVLTFRLRGGAAHYFAAPADWLLDFIDDEARYAPVAPLPGKSYWEQPIESQPYFLQAAALEQRNQWAPLDQLAQRWAQEEPADAEPVYLRGLANEGLEQQDGAIALYKQSLEIDAGYSRSWARLAYLYKKQGQLADARKAVARLSSLDPKLAREIAAELEKP